MPRKVSVDVKILHEFIILQKVSVPKLSLVLVVSCSCKKKLIMSDVYKYSRNRDESRQVHESSDDRSYSGWKKPLG